MALLVVLPSGVLLLWLIDTLRTRAVALEPGAFPKAIAAFPSLTRVMAAPLPPPPLLLLELELVFVLRGMSSRSPAQAMPTRPHCAWVKDWDSVQQIEQTNVVVVVVVDVDWTANQNACTQRHIPWLERSNTHQDKKK